MTTTEDDDKNKTIADLVSQIEDPIARQDDAWSSWAGAFWANKSTYRSILVQHLFDAGARGKTTNMISQQTGIPRDSFSPIPSRASKIITCIGTRYELNERGNLRPFNIYCLRIFLKPYPCPLGWQVLRSVQDKR